MGGSNSQPQMMYIPLPPPPAPPAANPPAIADPTAVAGARGDIKSRGAAGYGEFAGTLLTGGMGAGTPNTARPAAAGELVKTTGG